ncbi:MAG TPA: hypothetical protein VK588_12330, partial [Chitinophagaceae bacterium]|nr:hypothetical protein [Chitinophagaceae bacterium]
MNFKLIILLFLVPCISIPAFAQDSTTTNSIEKIPDKVFQSINKKASVLEEKLDKQTDKYLSKLERQENKLRRKLWKKDSTLAKELFDKTEEKYSSLRNISGKLDKYQALYSGHLDSLS